LKKAFYPLQYVAIQAVILTALIIVSLLWNITNEKKGMQKLTIEIAKTHFQRDVLYRRWSASHGGVYVPMTEKTPPNEFLTVEKRDIESLEGDKYTLINPAYMTRQVYELTKSMDVIQSHLTSLKPKRPSNKPDEWEKEALLSFELGSDEYFTFDIHNGSKHLRYMKPFITEESCLKCHADQGYKVGDIRGGMSFLIPMEPFDAISKKNRMNFIIGHFAIWVAGLFLLYLFAKSIEKQNESKKDNELKLLETKQFNENIVNSLSEGIIIEDAEGFIQFANPAMARILGYEKDELIGVHWEDIVPEEFRDVVSKANQRRENGQADQYEMELLCKNGEKVSVLVGGVPHFESKSYNGLLAAFTDITSQKSAEEDLRQSEERFKALHNASFGGIAIHDKGVILECNNGLAEITGFSHDELIGMNGLLLISEKTRDMVIANIAAGYEKPYEAVGVRKNGKEYPIRLEARNIPYKGKDVRVVEFRDLSEQKKLEEQLRQAQKIESIGHLAGGIAHDFNNLLTPIISGTELLMFNLDKSDQLAIELAEIRGTALRAAELTRQLLAFSRKQILQMKVVNINDLVSNFLSILRRTIREDVSINIDYGKIDKLVKVDVSQVEQILLNLAVNAQDAMMNGGNISIQTTEVGILDKNQNQLDILENGNFIELKVSDTGTGISDENIEKIFDPFFTTKDVGKGTGLGLSTVYGIVKQHGGTISVESTINKGTTFTIHFPVTAQSEEVSQDNAIPKDEYAGSGTILIVEDQAQVRKVAEKILTTFGYVVHAFDNGKDAIEKVKSGEIVPDLLLLDVIMPDMNGKKVLSELTEILPEIKALFMSGYPSDVIALRGVLDKDINFLQKPLSVKTLTKKVKTILSS